MGQCFGWTCSWTCQIAPVAVEGKLRDCDCVRVGEVGVDESTDSDMPGLVDPSVSEDISTDVVEGRLRRK